MERKPKTIEDWLQQMKKKKKMFKRSTIST